MNQKNLIAILVVTIVILFTATVYFTTTNKTKQTIAPTPKITKEPIPTPALPESTQPANNSLLYVNKTLGYQIKLPNNWTGYRVITDAYNYQNFQLPTSSKTWLEIDSNNKEIKGYGTVFTIMVRSLADWNKLVNDCKNKWGIGCITDNDALGRTDTTVFSIFWPNSGPSVEDDSVWGNLAREVSGIEYFKNNFSILK